MTSHETTVRHDAPISSGRRADVTGRVRRRLPAAADEGQFLPPDARHACNAYAQRMHVTE